MSVENYFHHGELSAQKQWNTSHIWDSKRREQLLWTEIPQQFIDRIANAPFFFLATSDINGRCDCSFKGGGAGLIKVISKQQFAFADISGNGAFMSLGNILVNPNVGCLFIDFTDGARLRVNGKATIHDSGPSMDYFPHAPRVIVVDIEQVIPNCNQHIPKLVPATNVNGEDK